MSSSTNSDEQLHSFGSNTIYNRVENKHRGNTAINQDLAARRAEEAYKSGQMNSIERLDYVDKMRREEEERKEVQKSIDKKANDNIHRSSGSRKYDGKNVKELLESGEYTQIPAGR